MPRELALTSLADPAPYGTGYWPTYTYDPKSRLTQDATTGANTHTYDYTYDGNDNRLTSNETGALATWTYDMASLPS